MIRQLTHFLRHRKPLFHTIGNIKAAKRGCRYGVYALYMGKILILSGEIIAQTCLSSNPIQTYHPNTLKPPNTGFLRRIIPC